MTDDQVWIIGAICCSFVLVMVILAVNDRQKRKLVDKAIRQGKAPPPKYRNYQTDWSRFWLLIFGVPPVVVLAVFQAEVFRAMPPNVQSLAVWFGDLSKSGIGKATIVIFSIVALIPFIALVWWRMRIKVRREAAKFKTVEQLALEGHVVEAHEEIVRLLLHNREDVESTRDPVALNYLASLQGMNGNWEHAVGYLKRLKLKCSRRPLFLAHEALALWMSGKTSEAADCVQRRNSYDSIARMTAGLFFAKAGNAADAGEVLDWIDQVLKRRVAPQLSLILGLVQDSIRQLVERAQSGGAIDDIAANALFDQGVRAILVCHCHVLIGVLLLERRRNAKRQVSS